MKQVKSTNTKREEHKSKSSRYLKQFAVTERNKLNRAKRAERHSIVNKGKEKPKHGPSATRRLLRRYRQRERLASTTKATVGVPAPVSAVACALSQVSGVSGVGSSES